MGVVERQRLEGSTKSGRTRIVTIDDTTVNVLKDHQKAQQAEKDRLGDDWQGENDDHVFLTAWGGPIYPTTVTNLPRKLIEAHNKTAANKLPSIRLHGLRHLHATMLLLVGVPVHVVAARLGHADPAITLRVYAHVIRSAETATADIFASVGHN